MMPRMHYRRPRLAIGLATLLVASSAATLATAPATAAADFPAYDSQYHTYPRWSPRSRRPRRCPPRHRRHQLDRQELQGPRHLGRQGLRQRRRPTSPSPRSCSTRSTTLASTSRSSRTWPILRWLTDGLRHGRADHPHRQHARGLDRLRGQPRRRRIRPDRLARTAPGARTASRTPGRPRSAPTSTGTTAIGGAAAAARPARNRPRPIAARPRSRRPRRAPSATSWPAAGSVAVSRSRPPSRSTRRVSRSCGRTATRRRTSRPT